MGFQRVVGLVTVFGLGIAVGGLLLRSTGGRPVSESEAQRRALRMLDQPPVVLGIGDNRIVEAVKRIEPAVVNIDTVGPSGIRDENGNSWFMDPNRESQGKGSGVILTRDGYIITCNHVVAKATRVRVTLPDGRWFYAHPVGSDSQNDLAVVRVDATDLPTASLGDSDHIQVGEWSIAVGNPLGLGSTVTAGIISALNRRNLQIDEDHKLDGAIQTDAAINRGNSGGALANINGQLIGINTAILSPGPSGGNIGLGFAIPINTVRRVARDLIANGGSRPNGTGQPWIGIHFAAVRQDLGQEVGLPADLGVSIDYVQPESPASIGGMEDGDILLSINGKPVRFVAEVREILHRHKIGDQITLHILRPSEQREHNLRIKIQERPESPWPNQ